MAEHLKSKSVQVEVGSDHLPGFPLLRMWQGLGAAASQTNFDKWSLSAQMLWEQTELWVVIGALEMAAFWRCSVKASTPSLIQDNKMNIYEPSMEEMGLSRNMRSMRVSFSSLRLHLHAAKSLLLRFPLPVGKAALRPMAVLLEWELWDEGSNEGFVHYRQWCRLMGLFLQGRPQCSWLKEQWWSFLEAVDLTVGYICDHLDWQQQLPLSNGYLIPPHSSDFGVLGSPGAAP